MSSSVDTKVVELTFEGKKFQQDISGAIKSLEKLSKVLSDLNNDIDFKNLINSTEALNKEFNSLNKNSFSTFKKETSGINDISFKDFLNSLDHIEIKASDLSKNGSGVMSIGKQISQLNEVRLNDLCASLDLTTEKITQMSKQAKLDKTARELAEINNTKLSDISNTVEGLAKKLETIPDAIEWIEKRFSALGVAGMTVISDITKGLTNKLVGAINTASSLVSQGGKTRALNLEQAKFMLKGLKADVESVMTAVDNSVTGTAYGLDEGAKAAASFYATGITDAKQLERYLKGIAGVAAMTGSEYSSIADIFTTVAGNGRLMSMQLLQLSGRGLNVAAVLGKRMKKSEREIRSLVSEGEISFEEFADAMNEEFGEHASKANETYSGSLSNLQTAFKRLGEKAITPLNKQLRILMNTTRKAVGVVGDNLSGFFKQFEKIAISSRKQINSLINTLIKNGTFKNIGKIITQSFKTVVAVLKNVKKAFNDAFPQKTAKELKNTTQSILSTIITLRKSINSSFKNLINVGVFTDIGKIIRTTFGAAIDLLKKIGKAYRNAFPKKTANNIKAATESILDFVTNLRHTINTSETLQKVLDTVFKGIRLGVDIIKIAASTFASLAKILEVPILTLTTVTDAVLSVANGIKTAFTKVSSIFKSIASVFTKTGESLKSFISDLGLLEKLASVIKVVGGALMSAVNWILNVAKKFFDTLGDMFGNVDGILRALITAKVLDYINNLGKTLQTFFKSFSDIGKMLKDFLKSLKQITKIVENIAKLPQAVVKLLDSVRKAFVAWQKSIEANILIKIAAAIIMIALALALMSTIDPKQLKYVGVTFGFILTALTMSVIAIFKELKDMKKISIGAAMIVKYLGDLFNALGKALFMISASIALLSVMDTKKMLIASGVIAVFIVGLGLFTKAIIDMASKSVTAMESIELVGGLLTKFAVSLLIISAAIAVLANLDTKQSGIATLEMLVLMTALTLVAERISKFPKNAQKSVGYMIGFAIAIRILASAVVKVGELDLKSAISATLSMVVIMATMGAIAKNSLSKGLFADKAIKAIGFMISMAIAIRILAESIIMVGGMKPEQAFIGVLSIIGLISSISIAVNRVSGKGSAAGVFFMLSLAASISILGETLMKLSSLSVDKAFIAVGSVAAVVGLMVIMFEKINKKKKLGNIEILLGMALALRILGDTLMDLSTLGWKQMAVSLVSVGAVIGMFVGVLAILSNMKNKASDFTKIGLSFLMLGAAVKMMGVSVKYFAEIPFMSLLQGFGALIVMVGIVVASLKLLANQSDSILKAAAGISLLALSISVLGLIGWAAVLTGLGALTSTVVVITAMAMAIDKLKLGEKLQEFSKTLVIMAAGIAALGLALIIVSTMPLVETIMGFALLTIVLLAFMGVSKLASKVAVDAVLLAAVMVLAALGIAAMSFAMTMLAQVPFAEVLTGMLTMLIVIGIMTLLGLTVSVIGPLILAFVAVMAIASLGIIAFGLAMQVLGNSILYFEKCVKGSTIIQSVVKAFQTMIKKVKSFLGIHSPSKVFNGIGGSIVDGLINGLKNLGSKLWEKLKKGFTDSIDSAKKKASDFMEVGAEILNGVKEGIASKLSSLKSSLVDSVNSAKAWLKDKLGIESPSKVFADEVGKYIGEGIALGIYESTRSIIDSLTNVEKSIIPSMQDAIQVANDLINEIDDVNPVITPVLDLSNVQNGMSSLNSMMYGKTLHMASSLENPSIMREQDIIEKMVDGVKNAVTEAMGDVQLNVSNTVDVPLTLDGKQIARASASYIQTEQNKIVSRDNRKIGILD